MMATRVLLIPSPLYVYAVHVFDTTGRMTTLVGYQSCQRIITYKIVVH
jgi:hypothetical protein